MSAKRVWAMLIASAVLGSTHAMAEDSCPRYTAPGQFDNTPSSWGDDSGPIVPGFIDSQKSRSGGGVLEALHGIDIAAGNKIDYSQISKCGGAFAIVRINHSTGDVDEEFLPHFAGLDKNKITAIPYYFLRLPAGFKNLGQLDNLTSPAYMTLRDKYAAFGVSEADKFLGFAKQLSEQNKSDVIRKIDIAGLNGKFVAVDVEETPSGEKGSTESARQNYGRLYASAVCAWVTRIRNMHPDFIPLLYTFPAIYGAYLQHADPAETTCLEGLPVWISRTYGDGWEAIHDPHTPACGSASTCQTNKFVMRLCLVQSGNRCILHQYTHRGTAMAMGTTSAKKIPPHLDMNRFYTSHSFTEANGVGLQYVRVEDPFRQPTP